MALVKNSAGKASMAKPKAPKKPEPSPSKAPEVVTDGTGEVSPGKPNSDPSVRIGAKELVQSMRAQVTLSGAAISPKVADIATVSLFSAVSEALKSGKTVQLPGLGVFSVSYRQEQTRPSPRDKTKMLTIPAHLTVKFKPAAGLKKALNGVEEYYGTGVSDGGED